MEIGSAIPEVSRFSYFVRSQFYIFGLVGARGMMIWQVFETLNHTTHFLMVEERNKSMKTWKDIESGREWVFI